MNILQNPNYTIAQRYKILNTLGKGGSGITYAALDLQINQTVALKMLSLRRMKDWKALELFKREAKILANLNHPAIPQYLDYFEIETNQEKAFYIVQELAPGKTLFDLVNQGWQPSDEEVAYIAAQVLDILVYLQQLTPAVIHRDIKPQNIIRQDNGKVFLVDFGAVQDTYHSTVTGGSTVVGTYGYMAPEQFRAQAVLSTDLYGLGATLLFLLTGQNPGDLPQHRLKIQFQSKIKLPDNFAAWLERMIEPDSAVRFQTAREANRILLGKEVIPPRAVIYEQPLNTRIYIKKIANKLIIDIPSTLLKSRKSAFYGFLLIASQFFFILACIKTSLFILMLFLSLLFIINHTFLFFVFISSVSMLYLSSLLFLIICNQIWSNGGVFPTTLEITLSQDIQVKFKNIFWKNFKTKTITEVSLQKCQLPFYKYEDSVCCINLGKANLKFGLFLSEEEKVWLVEEICTFLNTTNDYI